MRLIPSPTRHRSLVNTLLIAAAAAVSLLTGCGSDDETQATTVEVSVLSSPAHLISGGEALVEVSVQGEAAAPQLLLAGRDVSTALRAVAGRSGVYQGLITGIANGASTLEARVAGASTQIALTGYPITGPLISGPHQTPFICQTQTFRLPDGSLLGDPLDANCSIAPRVHYMYLATGATALAAMSDVSRLPTDVSMTTTSEGKTVPFVVRVETQTVNRGIYQSAVLHDPTVEAAPTPFAPPKAWNGRLIAGQGVGCGGGWYIQGNSQGGTNNGTFDMRLLSPARLGSGEAVYSNTLMYGSNNCNTMLVAEVAMMSKERFVKTHGRPAMTLGMGCSGGSYTVTQAADMLPGLYDGVLVLCTFVDGLSSSLAGADARLLARYLTVTNPAGFTAAQRAAISGYKGDAALRAAALNSNRIDPVPNRPADITGYNSAVWSSAVPAGLRYDPVANPNGARPTVYDAARNYLGTVPVTGFALRPYDNTGVQYGLKALNDGVISVDQFLDLNEAVGGLDRDANYTTARSVADLDAIERAHRGGLVLDGGGGLASIPVIDATGTYNEDSDYHQQWQHFALRERMLKANGGVGNHLMLRGLTLDGTRVMRTLVQWVQAYQNDRTPGTQREKVLRNRPADALDGCYDGSTFIAEAPLLSAAGTTPCTALLPSWTFPRQAAGGPTANDILKCTTKVPVASDYSVTFTTAQWQRLQTLFAQGVCDWSRPGVRASRLVVNSSFGPSPVNLVFNVLNQ
jgi:hypothetical protein